MRTAAPQEWKALNCSVIPREVSNITLSNIVLYTARAAAFALPVGILWAVIFRHRRTLLLKWPFVSYLAALIQITVIRDWSALFLFRKGDHTFSRVQLIPLRTTLEQLQSGLWPFCFHVIGNMIWFFPLGMLGYALFPRLRRARNLILLSVLLSGTIELGQWCLSTGVTDVDDIILNSAGAVTGWLLCKKARGFI